MTAVETIPAGACICGTGPRRGDCWAHETPVDRAASIGGSDVAAILGISPFRSPLDVWREKVLRQSDDIGAAAAVVAGNRFEPFVLEAYRKQLPKGSSIARPSTIVDGYRRASPDALSNVNGWWRIVEAKTTVMAMEWGSEGTDDVPLHYAVQGMWYADILGCDEIDYPVCIWPFEKRHLLGLPPEQIVELVGVRPLTIPFSSSLASSVRDRVDRFWNENVLGEEPPEARDLPDARRMVYAVEGKAVLATDAVIEKLMQRDELRARIKELQEQADAAETAVRNHLGDAEHLVHPVTGAQLVKCAVQERSGYTVKPTKTRPFTLTKGWKELQKNHD